MYRHTLLSEGNKPTHTVSSFHLILVFYSMTCTGGCGYSFNTPDDGCCDTRNMWSSFAVNKYLHTVASGWIFINIELRWTEPRA